MEPSPADNFRRLAVQVGRFQVFEEIARGGSGAVFRALDPTSGRATALKVQLTPTERQRKRLRREADLLTRLEHPQLVRALGVGEVHGHLWLAMELIDGLTLEQEVRAHGPLAPARAAELARKLALGLAYVHARGVLHRDLKPSNVLIDRGGQPRLVDFGLALDVDAHTRLSLEGAIMGTPGYWAPELARGQLGRIGPHSDVYGLGATLYFALTGKPPLSGETMAEVVQATLRARPDPPSRRNPAVSPELDAIVLRCLDKQPEQRWPGAQALAEALSAWLARGDPGPVRAARPRRADRRLLALASALAAAGGLAALGVALLRAGRADAPRPASATPGPGPVAIPAQPGPGTSPPPTPPGEATPEASLGPAQAEARALYERGRALVDARQYTQAQELLLRALELDPRLAGAHLSLGVCRDGQGDPAGAEQAFRVCVELDPRSAKGWTNLAVMLRRRGRPDEALECYEQALEADPAYVSAWANRAFLRLTQGDAEGAERDLDRALELQPDHPQALLNRARARLARRNPQQALEDVRAGLAVRPEEVGFAEAEVEALIALRRLEEAEQGLERLLARTPRSPAGLELRGLLCEQRGELGAARAAYDASLAARDEPIVRQRRGLLLQRQGELSAALADYERALELQPGKVELILLRASVKEALGDLAGSLSDLELALPRIQRRPELVAEVQAAIARLRGAPAPPR